MRTKEEEPRTCRLCGKLFIPLQNGAGRYYCTVACGEEAHAMQERKRKELLRKTDRPYNTRKPEKKKSNIDLINEINEKALAAGMSYGTYVLKLEMEKEAKRRKAEKAKCSRTVNGVIVPESILNKQIERR